VNDPETGLVYMQQRYYDPIAGRFLSVDPVTTNAKTGSHFNRYVYADNNPYKYTDPDGRSPVHAGLKALDLAVSAIDIMSAFQSGGASAGLRATLETVLAPPGAKLIAKVADKVGDVAKAGRGANHLKPDADAKGAHSTFKTNAEGKVTGHAEWQPNSKNPSGFDEAKRVDTQHAEPHTHHNKATGERVPTPHVHEKGTPGGVRPARPEELPK
jgi:RHS repeat-associated protein